MNNKYFFWIIIGSLGFLKLSAQQKYPCQNPVLSSEKRANDLTGRMTLEEKVLQLQSQMKFMNECKDRDFRVGNVFNIGHFIYKDTKALEQGGVVATPKHFVENYSDGGRDYVYNDDDGKPMFPFGFGLSYTTFEYSGLVLPSEVKQDGTVNVKFNLKNTGKVKGDELEGMQTCCEKQ